MAENMTPEPVREPILKAPWPVVALIGLLIGGYGVQSFLPPEQILPHLAFSSAGLAAGDWWVPVTALFLHGGWGHVLMNSAAVLAFGTPVARYFGGTGRRIALLAGFYLACGTLANLGYGWVHAGQADMLVGASGAVSGLMAGAARLMGEGPKPAPFTSPPVIGMTLAWLVTNLLISIVGFAPGAGGASVAWEAHLFGFAAGLVLFVPMSNMARAVT